MDFLHSRLAPPPLPRFGRRTVRLAAAGIAVLLILAGIGLDCFIQNSRVTDLNKELESLKVPSQEARKQVADFRFVQSWYDSRPEFLECLKEISKAFPQEGRCWATNLQTTEDMQVKLSAKAVNEDAAREVLDQLRHSPRLANVTLLFIHNTNDKSDEVSFDVLLKRQGGR
jgi:hypothetical protein